jgi:hypothetical protein
VHLEEDAGKSLHEGFADSGERTYLDFNRAGVPLIEIVTEPDIRSAAEASAFFEHLRHTLVWLGVNDGNMEEGSLRCDANVSVRPVGETRLGTKAEVKNLNSFRYVRQALEHEIERQIALIETGRRVVQETRLWDQAGARTVSMRSKEEAHDYRYFPEPDLPPVEMPAARLEALIASLPELPAARRGRFTAQFGLPEYDAVELTRSREVADYFEEVVAAGAPPKAASNWLMGEVTRKSHEAGVSADRSPVSAPSLAELIGPHRARHHQLHDREGRVREDVDHRPPGAGHRRRRRPGAGERRRRPSPPSSIRCWPLRRHRGAVSRRPDQGARLPRRPGDEGHRRQGQPETRQRPRPPRARSRLKRRGSARRLRSCAWWVGGLGPLLFYTAAAVVLTWPLVASLRSHLGAPEGPGDPYLNLWILGWDLRTMATHPRGCSTAASSTPTSFIPLPAR